MKILIGDLQNNPFPGGKGLFYKFLNRKLLPIQYPSMQCMMLSVTHFSFRLAYDNSKISLRRISLSRERRLLPVRPLVFICF